MILATAHSNAAVDRLMDTLLNLDIGCLRLGEEVNPNFKEWTFDGWINKIRSENPDFKLNFKNLPKLINESKIFSKKISVLCGTCVHSGSKMYSKLSFPYVLIDEVSLAIEPSILIPIVKKSKHVVLVGDHKQLGLLTFLLLNLKELFISL